MFSFLQPWHPCNDPRFDAELRREVGEKHVLFGVDAKIVARRHDIDDFLFALPDGRYANVHLTWSRESEPIWPITEIYNSTEEMETEIQRQINEWRESEST